MHAYFQIGEPTAMNYELLASENYYNATMEAYDKILLFYTNNNEIRHSINVA